MDVIAFIPARGGSKRVPGKNLALLNGKPLVVHTVEQAITSGIFGQIVVSTDDLDIKRAISGYQVDISLRPQALAGDDAVLLDVIRQYIKESRLRDHQILGILLVTAPLRTPKDIRSGYDLFVSSNQKNAVVSVCRDNNPMHLCWTYNGKKLLPVFPKEYSENIGKKDRMATYYFNDAIVFDSVRNFRQPGRNLFGNTPIPYLMPPERSIYIDYEFQLKLVKCLTNEER